MNFNEKEVLEKFYMNTNDIQQLIKRGFIGSYTHTHLPLEIYDEKTILYELETTKKYLANDLVFAPKRLLQTPQREWLAGDLKYWVLQFLQAIEGSKYAEWFDMELVHKEMQH